jgi:L-amino acid N-acyltransferase YncA
MNPAPNTTQATQAPLIVRPSTDADLPAITAIYAHAVQHGTGTFELEAPTLDDMRQRRSLVQARGWPWLVAVRSGAEGAERVLGYAYANDFRPRPAYRFCLEDSIYVAPEAQGQGVGHALLTELLARCEARGARQMLAVIGDSANEGSIALHRAHGFEDRGIFNAAGWKFNRWLDVVLMQRALGDGPGSPPNNPATLAT